MAAQPGFAHQKSVDELTRLSFIEMAEFLADAVLIAAPTGEIQYANQAMLNLSGYSMAELQGANVAIFRSGLMPDTVYQELWSSLTQGRPWRAQLVNRRKDGALYDVDVMLSPVMKAGQLRLVVGIERDITQAKTLERSNAQMATLGTVLAGVLKDFRDPLTLIKGGAEWGNSMPSEQFEIRARKAFALIAAGVKRLETLLDEMTRLAQPPEHGHARRILWAEVIHSALMLTAAAFSGITVTSNVDSKLASRGFYADFERILVNLLDNAAWAARQGGRAPAVHIAAQRDDGAVVITVEDNGPGIDKRIVDKLFSMPVSTRPKGRGTGLGLIVVRDLVQHNNGTFRFESGTEGTRFILRFGAEP